MVDFSVRQNSYFAYAPVLVVVRQKWYEKIFLQKEAPVNILRLRKIPVFDQVLTEFYGSYACDYFKNN
jgi:hypothetical protein